MSSTPYHLVNSLVFDDKVDSDAMEPLVVDGPVDILQYLASDFLPLLGLGALFAGHEVRALGQVVAVLVAVGEQEVAEVAQLVARAQLLHEAVPDGLPLVPVVVLEQQLVDALELLLAVDEPQPEVEQLALRGLQAEMDARHANEGVH